MKRLGCALFLLLAPASLAAQNWNSAEADALIDRAVERRRIAFADTLLRDWSARVHGFVFFLGQIGEGLAEPPRLIKSDQLELQVYWRAPNQSKQRIIGWRDRRDLPTDIAYHRDHLGIAMNNFPDQIRLGEGDEVRDVPHPVSAQGPKLYEYALVDSTTIALPDREIHVYEVRFRPRDFRAPRVIGSVFLDVGTADVVRMTFSFTRAAYLDESLEDITVAAENSLWAGAWWLPMRQEIEIRRRATFLDFPARGVIRGRFDIDGYVFNEGIDPAVFGRVGPEITWAPREVLDTFRWSGPLDSAVRDVARPANLADLDLVRTQATEMAMGHVITGLRQHQLAGGSVSDFAHVNRVEGLALGIGAATRSADEATELRGRVGVGTATGLFTGGLALTSRHGAWTLRLAGMREVRDIGDMPVISRAVNSISAQELGKDFGDYYLASGGSVSLTRSLGAKGSAQLEVGVEHIDSLVAGATWSRGTYARANPGADPGDYAIARFALTQRTPSFASSRDLSGHLEVEGGVGDPFDSYGPTIPGAPPPPGDYLRAFGDVRWQLPAGATTLLLRAAGGYGTASLPRQRAFVLGGRGTLLGEVFRSFGGRAMAWGSAEWRLPVTIPELKLGSFAGTGRTLTIAPNVAVGWVGKPIAGLFAPVSGDPVTSLGLGAAWFHDLVRFDLGYAPRVRTLGFAFDVSRDFWDIL
ncbi:MAG: hypothetical protein ACHQX4_10090 [Gemmatimonadales bacterium]